MPIYNLMEDAAGGGDLPRAGVAVGETRSEVERPGHTVTADLVKKATDDQASKTGASKASHLFKDMMTNADFSGVSDSWSRTITSTNTHLLGTASAGYWPADCTDAARWRLPRLGALGFSNTILML